MSSFRFDQDEKHQYQTDAMNSITALFKGQPPGQGSASIMISVSENEESLPSFNNDIIFGNRLMIEESQILANLREVQKLNGLKVSEQLEGMHFSVEMETGTGKTFVFLRTIHELHKTYGFSKFIIVVPSIAIREGAKKNLEITKDIFRIIYPGSGMDFDVYDPKNKVQARNFARSQSPRIMVINIDSFSRWSEELAETTRGIIYRNSDWGVPIEYISSTRPIVIIDEPQNIESENRKQAIVNLNPLFSLRYSATHRTEYNLIYKLDPVRAYDLGLVKKIEVDSTVAEATGAGAFIELVDIKQTRKSIVVKLKIEVNSDKGVERKELKIEMGKANAEYDLYRLSNEREAYKNNLILASVNFQEQSAKFANGLVLRKGETVGGLKKEVMKLQIENTIRCHLERQKVLRPLGIKVLSLFFIDKVSNYRKYDENSGIPCKGEFAEWFEEAFDRISAEPVFHELIPFGGAQVHDGYFAMDKKTVHSPFEECSMPSSKTSEAEKNSASFDLIMRDKERLLSLEEPLSFIFSHSALREGWDNPNVFQICTLNEVKSEIKKRQEIGRGLRLPVYWDDTEKVYRQFHDPSGDKNVLRVFANETFADFAKALQKEIQEECGVEFGGRIKDSRKRRRLKPREKLIEEEEFKELWRRISVATRYRVEFDSDELVDKAAEKLKNAFIPKMGLAHSVYDINISLENGNMNENKPKVLDAPRTLGNIPAEWIPDIIGKIQERSHLTRKTVWRILQGSDRIKDITLNPDGFIEISAGCIQEVLDELLVKGIKYEKIEVPIEGWDMHAFASEEIEGYIEQFIKVNDAQKTIYLDDIDKEGSIPIDNASKPEKNFAEELDKLQNVKFYMKLPKKFKIPTPLGNYTPDWAVVFDNDRRLYFVAETKSFGQELRPSEEMKIKCGRKHFDAIKLDDSGPLYFGPASDLETIIKQIPS